MSGAAGAAAAAAAAAAALRMRQEEEELTSYGPQDLSEGWEFKILRSSTSAFKNPERLKSVLAEEAAAGWTLVEKFDNGRIRLKRPVSARAGDHALGFDPYRTSIGMTDGKLGLMIAGIIVVAMLLVILIVGLASRS
jgi:hypothetical protein